MPNERQQIIHLIGQLAQDDEKTRLEAEHALVDIGECAVKLLTTGFEVLPTDLRPTLVRILHRIGDPRALTALMRYVFDARAEASATLSRAQAMQAIMELARPQDESRLFAFLVDLSPEADELVRTYVVECFARLHDPRALGHLRAALRDPSPFVRKRARLAFQQLQITQQIDPLTLGGEDFLRLLVGAEGAHREHLKRLILRRSDALDLASELVRQDTDHSLLGLEVLRNLGAPAGREVALRHFWLTRMAAGRIASLQLLAEHLRADARPQEVRAIEAGLEDPDRFVRLAALAAAGRAGQAKLLQLAIQSTRVEDSTTCAIAAEALASVATHLPACWARGLMESVGTIRARRRFDPQPNLAACEASLLCALGALLKPGDDDARRAQLCALTSLKEGLNCRPVIVAAVGALERITPEEDYGAHMRWHPADAVGLGCIDAGGRRDAAAARTGANPTRGAWGHARAVGATEALDEHRPQPGGGPRHPRRRTFGGTRGATATASSGAITQGAPHPIGALRRRKSGRHRTRRGLRALGASGNRRLAPRLIYKPPRGGRLRPKSPGAP